MERLDVSAKADMMRGSLMVATLPDDASCKGQLLVLGAKEDLLPKRRWVFPSLSPAVTASAGEMTEVICSSRSRESRLLVY